MAGLGCEKLPIVSYGLGSLNEDRDSFRSRIQLIILNLLAEYLSSEVLIFDPRFNDFDLKILEDYCNFKHIDNNEECKRTVVEPTIFFVEGLDYEMTNNLLAANWGVDKLSNVIIIHSDFIERWKRNAHQ